MAEHFANMIAEQAAKYGEKSVFRFRRNGEKEWQRWSWNTLSGQVDVVARALATLGVAEHDRVGQCSQNMPENLVVDFALYSNRAVLVPIYATSSPSQIAYIVNDSGMKILFVGEQMQYDAICETIDQCTTLQHIVAIDSQIKLQADNGRSMYYTDLCSMAIPDTVAATVAQRRKEAVEDDMSAILYTSGTTGNPKGVVLVHSGFNQAMHNHDIRLTQVNDTDVSIAFLPLTHVFERLWCYFCLHKGVEIVINLRPQEIQQTIKEIHPTLMCAVPRFWEKVYIGIKEQLSGYTAFMLGVVTWAITIGKKYNVDHLRVGKKPHWWLRVRYRIADKLIFSKVKLTLGIESGKLFPTAGAALADNVNLFFQSIGIPICYGYGLTESYATVSCFPSTGYEIGSIGTIMPNVEVRIGEDNEIMLRGNTVCKGYYNRPDINATAFTEDGFFRTGDAGYIKGNHLYLTERIKDLFKTSNGKYISPQQIETLLTTDSFIEQVAVIGDQRNYVTAIVVPNLQMLEKEAQKQGWSYQTVDELLQMPVVYNFYEQKIQKIQANMAHFEVVKKITLIKKGFAIETGELTNTLKLRRAIIQQKYAKQIDAMYEDSARTIL